MLFPLAACGSGTAHAGCAAPHHDPFDPRSVVHVLAGAVPPPYLTDPPTSGEHQPVNVPSYRGIRTGPIPPAIQVALLESSQVLVQYRSAADGAQLVGLTSNPLVTVAPNPSLPAAIVATGWQWRVACQGPASAALTTVRRFVSAHAGKGPQPPPPAA